MLEALLPSIRSLRSSLLTGALMVGSAYVLFGYPIASTLTIHPAAKQILDLAPFMPQLLLGIFAYLIGSLYVTGLEGIVDWAHRNAALKRTTHLKAGPRRWLRRSIMPLSDAARHRVEAEAARYFNESSIQRSITVSPDDVQIFVQKVILETLWMEGKLAGTALSPIYEQYRSEGELRLGLAILFPFAIAAVAVSVGLGAISIIFSTAIAVLVAIQLANYGLYYFRRAHSFLAHHIADGKVLTPSMETLKQSANEKKILRREAQSLLAPKSVTNKSGSRGKP